MVINVPGKVVVSGGCVVVVGGGGEKHHEGAVIRTVWCQSTDVFI